MAEAVRSPELPFSQWCPFYESLVTFRDSILTACPPYARCWERYKDKEDVVPIFKMYGQIWGIWHVFKARSCILKGISVTDFRICRCETDYSCLGEGLWKQWNLSRGVTALERTVEPKIGEEAFQPGGAMWAREGQRIPGQGTVEECMCLKSPESQQWEIWLETLNQPRLWGVFVPGLGVWLYSWTVGMCGIFRSGKKENYSCT